MNTISEIRRGRHGRGRTAVIGLAVAALLILGACIQGPWDYYPDNPPPFRGVFLTGYMLSGNPVQHVCFERVLDISEEATQAFAFYESADVRIAGRFSGGLDTLVLTTVKDTPNCFQGDPRDTVEVGQAYDLTARFRWDSAGTEINSVLTARARVPTSFKLHDSAAAPSVAFTPGIPANIFTPEFIALLPEGIRNTLNAEFPEVLPLIVAAPKDSAGNPVVDSTSALGIYIKANGAKIQDRLLKLLGRALAHYPKNATLYYMNGALNTLSHYFESDRSPDVGCVLISQRFDSNSGRPETRFDSPVGILPDSSEYFFPGYIRRLLIYPDAKSDQGWNLLDSMGVVNTWFHTQRNRLYFYGFESAYYGYLSTVLQVQGGEGGDADPRIKAKFNVQGGAGIFVGGIPDSFDVYIDTVPGTLVYPLQVTHALYCEKEGWNDNKDCREYYPRYCRDNAYKPAVCASAAITACLIADWKQDTALKALCAPVADTAKLNGWSREEGEDDYCIARGFPADDPVCAGASGEKGANARCLETQGINGCKQTQWDYCLDHAWPLDSICGPGIASYCHDKPRLSETLCKHADAWCAANPGSVLCK